MAKAEPITGLNAQASTQENARIITRTKLDELYVWQEYVPNPDAHRELHNMRIAAKRLRYTLEIFADSLPTECANAQKEVKQLQEELGLLHDSDVVITMLRLCLTNQQGNSKEKATQRKQARSLLPPDLISLLLAADATPNAEQRYGLEQLLSRAEQERTKHYQDFYQHWQLLQEQGFRQRLSAILS